MFMCAVKMQNLDRGSFVSIAQQWKLEKSGFILFKKKHFSMIFDILKKRVVVQNKSKVLLKITSHQTIYNILTIWFFFFSRTRTGVMTDKKSSTILIY
jgi:hypothetical protein